MIHYTKEKFLQTSNYVRQTLQEIQLDKEIIQSTGLEQSLARIEKDTFKVAVVAPFSAGKSTFINSLIGYDLLSTSILVETAAITTVKYGEIPKAKINYNDGTVIELQGDLDDLQQFKNDIKRYTVVNRESDDFSVESLIRNVEVFWPIELCKSGVEIIDTPGLFAQYEAHSNITASLLKTTDAVIFLIDPSTVGEVNFMKVIREYVENAKSSKLTNSDSHIFFVVNKIDQYPEAEVEKAYAELSKILTGVLKQPRIFKVSAYFGLMTQLYEQGFIDLNTLRRNESIRFTDEEGFVVAGRSIEEKDVQTLKKISNIQSVYQSLGIHFEEEYGSLVDEIFEKLNRAIQLKIEQLDKQLQLEEKKHLLNHQALVEKGEELKDFFSKEIANLKINIESVLSNHITSATAPQSISSQLRQLYNGSQIEYEAARVVLEAKLLWTSLSEERLNLLNADEIVAQYFKMLDLKIETLKQNMTQKVFSVINEVLEKTVKECEVHVVNMESAFNTKFDAVFNLSSNQQTFFDFQELLKDLQAELVEVFKGNASDEMSEVLLKNLDAIEDKNSEVYKVKGLWNTVRGMFGLEKYGVKFSLTQYQADITNEIELALDELKIELSTVLRKASSKLFTDVGQQFSDKIQELLIRQRIVNYEKWQSEQLEQILVSGELSEQQYLEKLKTFGKERTALESLLQQNHAFIEMLDEQTEQLKNSVKLVPDAQEMQQAHSGIYSKQG